MPAWTVIICSRESRVSAGIDRLDKAEPRGLAESATDSRHATQFAGQAYLAQGDDTWRHRLVARR